MPTVAIEVILKLIFEPRINLKNQPEVDGGNHCEIFQQSTVDDHTDALMNKKQIDSGLDRQSPADLSGSEVLQNNYQLNLVINRYPNYTHLLPGSLESISP